MRCIVYFTIFTLIAVLAAGCRDENTTEIDSASDTDTDADSDSDTDVDSDSDTDTDGDTDADGDSDTDTDTDSDADTGTGDDTAPDFDTDTETDTDTIPGTGITWLDNGTLKIGVDLDRGGALAWLSTSGSSRNLINVHDEGRYIQQSYYAGQDIDRQAEGQLANWSPWPWNPVQAGDTYENRSTLLSDDNNGSTIYTKTLPKLWDMNNEDAQAHMEQWVTLEGTSVHVRNRLTTFRTDDRWDTRPKHQELPAFYVIASLSHLKSYTGDNPFTSGALSELTATFPWQSHVNLERWAAFVDDSDWGVGVFSATAAEMLCGQFLGAVGESTDNATNYIAPVATVTIPKVGTYGFEYWVVVANLADIRTFINQKAPSLVAFPSKFFFDTAGDMEGFVMNNGVSGNVIDGALNVQITGGDPYFSAPGGLFFDAATFHYLTIRVKNQSSSTSGQLFFSRKDRPAQLYSIGITLPANDGAFHDVIVDMSSASTDWANRISSFRIDPVNSGTGSVQFDVIAFNNAPQVPVAP